jgi:hypothetical protein
MSDLPIACTLSASERRARKDELLPGLLKRAEQTEEIPDGRRYRFAASSDVLLAIARVMDAERQCCRFLFFHLTVEPDLGPFWLDVIGPPGTLEFLDEMELAP